jgi:phosphatidylglycerophosphatase A
VGKINTVWRKAVLFCVTGGGAGYVPRLPGTIGTLVAVPFSIALNRLAVEKLPLASAIVVLSVLCAIRASTRGAAILGQKDPQIIVVDEIVGFLVGNFLAPLRWTVLFWSFLLFRFFDITKLFPSTDWNSCLAERVSCSMMSWRVAIRFSVCVYCCISAGCKSSFRLVVNLAGLVSDPNFCVGPILPNLPIMNRRGFLKNAVILTGGLLCIEPRPKPAYSGPQPNQFDYAALKGHAGHWQGNRIKHPMAICLSRSPTSVGMTCRRFGFVPLVRFGTRRQVVFAFNFFIEHRSSKIGYAWRKS